MSIALTRRGSTHGLAFLFGLSISVVLTMCSEGESSGQDSLEQRVADLEALVANATATQTQFIDSNGLAPINLSGEQQWTLAEIEAASSGYEIVDIVDDTPGTRTLFVAMMPCRVDISIHWQAPAVNLTAAVFVNGTQVNRGDRSSAASGVAGGDGAIYLEEGDELSLAVSSSAQAFTFTMVVTAELSLETLAAN